MSEAWFRDWEVLERVQEEMGAWGLCFGFGRLGVRWFRAWCGGWGGVIGGVRRYGSSSCGGDGLGQQLKDLFGRGLGDGISVDCTPGGW